MKNHKAKKDFLAVVSGANFMTPHVIDYYYNKDETVVIELSEGTGFASIETFYGVTVVDLTTKTNDHDKSKMFTSKAEAMEYIQTL